MVSKLLVLYYCFFVSQMSQKDIDDVKDFGIKQKQDFYQTAVMRSTTDYILISLCPSQYERNALDKMEGDGKGYCYGKRYKEGQIFDGKPLPVDIWKDWSIIEVSTP